MNSDTLALIAGFFFDCCSLESCDGDIDSLVLGFKKQNFFQFVKKRWFLPLEYTICRWKLNNWEIVHLKFDGKAGDDNKNSINKATLILV